MVGPRGSLPCFMILLCSNAPGLFFALYALFHHEEQTLRVDLNNKSAFSPSYPPFTALPHVVGVPSRTPMVASYIREVSPFQAAAVQQVVQTPHLERGAHQHHRHFKRESAGVIAR